MFKIRYKSHHDVGNIISKFTQNLKASKNDFLNFSYKLEDLEELKDI